MAAQRLAYVSSHPRRGKQLNFIEYRSGPGKTRWLLMRRDVEEWSTCSREDVIFEICRHRKLGGTMIRGARGSRTLATTFAYDAMSSNQKGVNSDDVF